MSLPDCQYRLECGDAIFCRHSRVNIAGQRVREAICVRCTDHLELVPLRDFTCEALPDQSKVILHRERPAEKLLGDRVAALITWLTFGRIVPCDSCQGRKAKLNQLHLWLRDRWQAFKRRLRAES